MEGEENKPKEISSGANRAAFEETESEKARQRRMAIIGLPFIAATQLTGLSGCSPFESEEEASARVKIEEVIKTEKIKETKMDEIATLHPGMSKEEIESMATRAVRYEEQLRLNEWKGDKKMEEKQYERAARTYEEAEAKAKAQKAWTEAAKEYLSQGEIRSANFSAKMITVDTPEVRSVFSALGDKYMTEKGRLDIAVDYYEKAGDTEKAKVAYEKIAENYEQSGGATEALRWYEKIGEDKLKEAGERMAAGKIKKGDDETAAQIYELSHNHDKSAEIWAGKARELIADEASSWRNLAQMQYYGNQANQKELYLEIAEHLAKKDLLTDADTMYAKAGEQSKATEMWAKEAREMIIKNSERKMSFFDLENLESYCDKANQKELYGEVADFFAKSPNNYRSISLRLYEKAGNESGIRKMATLIGEDAESHGQYQDAFLLYRKYGLKDNVNSVVKWFEQHGAQIATVTDVRQTSWQKEIVVRDEVRAEEIEKNKESNKNTGTAVGAAVGYLRGGGISGMIGWGVAGRIVGGVMTDESDSYTRVAVPQRGYILTLNNGQKWRVLDQWKVGEVIPGQWATDFDSRME